MNGIKIANFDINNLDSFGELLHSNLVSVKSDFDLVHLDGTTTTEVWTAVKAAISNLLTTLGVGPEYTEILNNQDIKIGDILSQPGNNNKLYIVTGRDGNSVRTFPFLLKEDKLLFGPFGITSLKISRPDYGKIQQKSYEEFARNVLTDSLIEEADVDGSSFKSGSLETETTHLQIGDLIFGVDPIQISFTTQNGYQIFPTLRTDGNPKLSTGQQIKNISVTLIFPNVDAINYQLIPLYAMFRRTPFVNIKNREITKFFSDVISHPSSDWIPVALESINIQSIDGFPSSLQADISFLPIDPRHLGTTGLNALLSINDVINQQDELNRDVAKEKRDRQLAFKAGTTTTNTATMDDVIVKDIQYSEDFRQSLPFRAFYQSLIGARTTVLKEDGTPAVAVNSEQALSNTNRAIFEQLRPIHSESLLGTYAPEHNNSAVSFTYTYIPKTYIEVARTVSNNRSQLLEDRVARLAYYINNIKNPKDLAGMLVPFFTNQQDIIREQGYQFSQYENVLRTAFQRQGWDLATEPQDQPLNLFSMLIKNMLYSIGVQPAWGQLKETLSIISNPANNLERIGSSIMDALYGCTITYTQTNANGKSIEINLSFEQALQKIMDYAESRPPNEEGKDGKQQLVELFDEIANRLADPIEAWKNDLLVTDMEGAGDESGFNVERLPIKPVVITIDNKNDIISAWNLTFSNKFVPFYLQLNKYPFYQHLGFEDATLSLRVISVPRPDNYDLKAELSLMSDRMAESTKIVTYTSPELSLFMDPRVTLESKPNSIFNALGVTKVVLNSSNTTNRQGQPNSWNTVINLTQAKFSVDKYHNVEHLPNNFLVEQWLMNLILRLKFINDDPKQGITVKKYYGTDGVEPESKQILYMSWVDSSYSEDFEKHVAETIKQNPDTRVRPGRPYDDSSTPKELQNVKSSTTGTELVKTFDEQKKILNKVYPGWNEVDTKAKAALDLALRDNQQLSDALTLILINYNRLLGVQTETLKGLVQPRKSWIQEVLPALSDSWQLLGNLFLTKPGAVAVGAVIGATVFAFSLPVWLCTAVIGGVGVLATTAFVGVAGAEVFKNSQVQTFSDQLSTTFIDLMESMKKELIITLAHQISKDPYIRDSLLSKEILYGDRIEKNPDIVQDPLSEFKKKETEFAGFNCYPDFDLKPQAFNKAGVPFRVAPDFYLAIGAIHQSFVQTYIEDGFKGILRTAQAAMELCMLSRTDSLLRFNNILRFIESGSYDGLSEPVLGKLKTIFGMDAGGIESALKTSVSNYITMVLLGTSYNLKENEALIPVDQQAGIREQFIAIAKERKLNDEQKKELEQYLEDAFTGTFATFRDTDAMKYNYIVAQRDIILIELLELFYSISSYFRSTGKFAPDEKTGDTKIEAIFKKIAEYRGDKGSEQVGTANIIVTNAMDELKTAVGAVLSDPDNTTTEALGKDLSGNAGLQLIQERIASVDQQGIAHDAKVKDKDNEKKKNNTEGLSIPELRLLQNMVFNKIGYFIRLNTAIQVANKFVSSAGVNASIDLDTLPELKFLDYFNRRELESSFRKLRLMEDFENSTKNESSLNSRLFPTFKILFIEEDGKVNLLDDYYSFNAVQSIEIVKNKNFASSTAVLRLSNLTGSITDRLSLHREASDMLNVNRPLVDDELFFGTLNLKPGSKIMIKVGYGTSDLHLKTVFTGRILEMNVGPVTEIICQSFGAQLKHELISENFGFFASIKQHGDIASSLLDKIPGLENFGSKELFSLIGTTSGKQFKNIRRNIFDRFIMSNLLTRVGAFDMASDNPRDENIYLPYDLSNIAKWDCKFNWKVYKQSVWDAIKELCLYNTNTVAIIRPYNIDSISSRSEQRETIVVGKKSGYYKFTDAYSLSSMDYLEIDARLGLFKEVKTKLTKENASKIKRMSTVLYGTKAIGKTSDAVRVDGWDDESKTYKVFLKEEWDSVWKFFRDKTNYVIISKYLIGKINPSIESVADLVNEFGNAVSWKQGGEKGLMPEEIFVKRAAAFLRTNAPDEPTKSSLGASFAKLAAFENMIMAAAQLPENIWDGMSKDSFYEVRLIEDNNDRTLSVDPRYKKIQSHHFISDTYNMLNNNLILNNGFANMVNLYYFDNPKLTNEMEMKSGDMNNINVWPVKAFRDIKDEFIRPLNSFQKNIDTSWRDCVNIEDKLKGYHKIKITAQSADEDKVKEDKTVKGQVEKALTDSFPEFGQLNLDQPDWRAFPSFMGVGVNLLKKEVETMYRGSIQIVGDPTIEPMDIVHIEDLLNDTNGAVEVDEVIHIFTPDQGFITTITPSLITYDRDPQQLEDISIVNRVFSSISTNRKVNTYKAAVGGFFTLLGVGTMVFSGGTAAVEGLTSAAIGLPLTFSGINGMNSRYHRFLYDTMIEIMGGDVINFTALMHKGLPLMCGFDGVDYTNLRTIINHRSQRIEGFVNRVTAARDPYGAWLFSDFNPSKTGVAGMFINTTPGLRQLFTLKDSGRATESIGFWETIFRDFNPFEIKF